MKKLTAIIAVFSLLFASSCRKDSIRGGGSITSEQRNISGFTGVEGNADIKVHIMRGSTSNVEVRGYSNLVAITETDIVNGKLVVKYQHEYYNVKNSNIEVYITMPSLDYVATNGSGDVWIDGFNNNSLSAYINGSSNMNISNCVYDHIFLDINGSGNIVAAGLLSNRCEATIHGSGDIEISCSQNLKARIYGSGDIRYWGTPSLDVAISGSGTVTRQ